MFACGATPEMSNAGVTKPDCVVTTTSLTTLPPDVDAVWEPWPS